MSGRRTEQHQCYMDFAPLILYLVAVIIRQARCHAVCSKESVEEVEKLLGRLTRKDDCKLYTPTPSDYEQNCSRSLLRCFEKEATVLITENNELPKKLLNMLKKLGLQLQDKRQTCPACEVYREEEAVTFLLTLRATLQRMNSMNNC
ncbi:hypothetical protein NFI96_024864 [Prochilodus magdalenae]|nr:hypothetical protein NFI96_024864 [Prochilodus magdalenae]